MLETVKIRTKPCKGNPEGSITINKTDFDPRTHQLFDEASFKKFSQEEVNAINKQMEDEEAEKDRLEKEEADRLAVEKDEADKLAAAATPAKVEEKVEGKKSKGNK